MHDPLLDPIRDLLDAVQELGDRFPDMTDNEILLWCDEYRKLPLGTFTLESTTGKELIAAYERGSDYRVIGTTRYCEDYPCCGHEAGDCDGSKYGSDESIKAAAYERMRMEDEGYFYPEED